MAKLRYGIIGCGGISKKHLMGYGALKDEVELRGVCDIVPERMDRAAETWGSPRKFKDYHELLDSGELDFVSVCTPNNLHAPMSIEALEKGIHVHCEKPMAFNEGEARAMLEARNKTGRQLMIGLNNRFSPFARYAKTLVLSGALGEIYHAKCGWQRRNGLPYRGWFGDPAVAGGGALIDLGVHYIDLTLHLMDFPPLRSVLAKTYNKFGDSPHAPVYTYLQEEMEPGMTVKTDDLAAGFILCKNDASITFEISWASNIEKEKVFLELYGVKGGIKFENDFKNPPVIKIFTVMNGQFCDIIPDLNPVIYKETEFSHFVGSIKSGKAPLIAPPEEGVKMMGIIDAIYRSSRENREIHFTE